MKLKSIFRNLQLLLPMLAVLISSSKASSEVTYYENNNLGLYASSVNAAGIEGVSTYFQGLYGYSTNSDGVYGFSANYVGVEAQSPNIALYAHSGSNGYAALFTGGRSGNGSCVYAGGAGWSCSSDRNLKENFTAIDVKEIVQRISQLPITRWNMKGEKTIIKHIGPMAQDFSAAFNIGEDDKRIDTADIQGVALAGIKGLYQMLQEKDAKIQKQEAEIVELHKQMDTLKSKLTTRLDTLEQTIAAGNLPPVNQRRIAMTK